MAPIYEFECVVCGGRETVLLGRDEPPPNCKVCISENRTFPGPDVNPPMKKIISKSTFVMSPNKLELKKQ